MPQRISSSGPGKSHTMNRDNVIAILAHFFRINSIESNIIIMASCIPTLGPLYEMLRGKRSWSSHQRSYRSNGAKLNSSLGRPVKKRINHLFKDDDLMNTTIGATKQGSQESILNSEEARNKAHPMGSIHTTD
jgi:hypothetical protein